MPLHPHEHSSDAAATIVSRWWRTSQYEVAIPLASGLLASGVPMSAFADNAVSNPGITVVDGKSVAIRWNNNASQTAVFFKTNVPAEVDTTRPFVVHLLASKTGATLADATTFTVSAFLQVPGALHDADANFGGVTSALVGDAPPKTVAELTRVLAATDLPLNASNDARPMALTLSIKPTDGLLGTDDVCVHKIWIEATRLGLMWPFDGPAIP